MLSPTSLYILLVFLLLVLGIIFLYVVIRKARRAAAPPEAEIVAAPAGGEPSHASLKATSLDLKLSFNKAIRRMRLYGKGSRYRTPLYLLIGETHSGKTTLLSHTGMELLANAPEEQRTGIKQGLNWFFFNQGIVLDVAGDLVLRADGATSNVKGWNYLTKLLRRYRPERPLDGIILAIPCSDLVGTSSQSPEFKLKLEQKAQSLYNKLVDAQKHLGLSFPVYVLITKCDEVTGFKSLCHEIPTRRDEMFGWSSPYTREVAYRADWVTEAFQNLHGYLFELQTEIFTEHARVANSDEFFMLPTEIRAMRAPLQIYLDRIFKESAYHDPFFLRGIYFCGDSTAADEVPAPAVVLTPTEPKIHWQLPQHSSPQPITAVAVTPPAPPVKKHAFLEHLFERKIFQEELLARPINRTALSRNRMVLVAQVLSVAIPLIGILGILATYPALKERVATFYTYLAREEQDLKAIKAEKESGVIEDQSRGREARLFEAMSNMSGKRLISPFIPGSWFSNVREQSGDSISGAYQFVVYDSLRLRLDCRTESKLIPLPLSQACYATVGIAPETALNKCAFENDYSANSVHTFIESLNELIQNRARYNRLIRDDSGDPNDLNQLLRYFDHAQLPADFDVHNSLFVQALRTSLRPPLRTTDQSVYDRGACKVEGMIQDIYDRTFKNQNVTYGYLGDITKTEILLARPENSWLANRVFEYPSAFQGLTFAAGLSELKRALNDLSKEKFMSRDYGTQPGTPLEPEPQFHHQARSTLIWDKATLQQAVDLYKEYDNFVKNKSYNRLDTLDSSVKRAARNDLSRKLAVLIARAPRRGLPQRMAGESARKASLRVEIKSLVEAQDLLSNLLDISRSLRIDVGLRSIVVNQMASLMNAIDEEFYDGSFYTMAQEGFSWWTSDITFHSYRAFGASNPDELEVYLAMQREDIAELARQYAAPVLGFAAAQNISLRSSVDWKEILDQLDKYDAKKPGNTVTVLENFIRFEMDKVKLDNCSSIVGSSNLQLDYFIRVRNSLRQPFYLRCKTLADAEMARANRLARQSELLARRGKEVEFYQGLKSYTDIQDTFNRTLGGKFPFSKLPESEPFKEADPESINAFFELLAKNKEAATNILKQAPNYNISSQEALDFLEQMEAVRVFFDAFLSKKQVYPAFDFSLRFRANEGKEIGANQVIDWAFDVGKRRFHYRDTVPSGMWGYGESLSVSLRWANDSPTIPAFKFDPLSHMKLEGQTVTLTYNNNWSLLYFILKHRGTRTDFKEGVDIEPYTLKIEIPTQPNAKLANKIQQAQPETLRTKSVEVFMRIALMAPGKKDSQEPLILPDVFPTRAPQLIERRPDTQQSRENRSN
ncbi:MAG TPA: type VI secretion system protein [Pyrinomonadaceae bacterium]|nr:type VI secretion system protein [Pyrinomonadaceae bacterium]